MPIAKRLFLASTCLCLTLSMAAHAAEAAPQAATYALPAQNLSDALLSLARRSNRNILFPPELVSGRRSGAVAGAASFEQALSLILAGTGLVYVIEADGSATILGRAAAPSEAPARAPARRVSEVDTDQPAELAEVVVTGARRSLAEALRLKQSAVGVMDAVAAEDLGKFPEENLAEAIQRVPGVAISRDQGEGGSATIRGLPPALTQVLVNGKTAAAGGVGREFSFDIFSADLFSVIEVIKSSSADQEEGGVAGTISLHTPLPLDLPDRAGRLNLQASYVDIADKTDPRASAMFSGRFAGGRLGALLSLAYSDRSLRQDNSSGNGWVRANVDTNGDGQIDHRNVYVARLLRSQLYLEDRRRLGAAGVVQFAPSDRAEITFDATYSNFEIERFHTNRAYSFADGGVLVGGGAVEDGTLVAGRFSNTRVRSTVRTQVSQNDILLLGLKGRLDLEDWALSGAIGYSYAESHLPDGAIVRYETRSTVGYDTRANPRFPEIIGGPDPITGAGMAFNQIQFDSYRNRDDELALQADASRRLDWRWASSLDFGVKWKQREKDRDAFLAVSTVGRGALLSAIGVPFPVDDYFGGEGGPNFIRGYMIPDVEAVRRLYYPAVIPRTPDELDSFNVVEEVTAGYGKLNLDFGLFGAPVRGDLGVRVVRTNQTSSGFIDEDGVVSPITVERSYTDVLPSANLRVQLRDDVILRLGLARVMTRPELADISPRREIFSGQQRLEEGNVHLDPFRASQADVSLEWYLSSEGLLAAALFHKDIESFTATRETLEPFRGETYLFSRIINGDGGRVSGLELSFQQPLTWAPAPFDGLGVALNYTYAESDTQFPSEITSERFPLEGLSRNTYNAVLYYEKSGLGLRVAYTYRDRYLETALGAGGTPLYVAGYGQVDASASYQITDRVMVQVQGLNLGDSRQYRYSGRPNQITDYDRTGPKYFVGLSARF